jgi:hypothetical protein
MLSFTDLAGRRVVEPGTFDIRIGHSSDDQPLRGQLEVRGTTTCVDGSMRLACETRVALQE